MPRRSIADTPQNEAIIKHLLEVGKNVTPEQRADVESQMTGPGGTVILKSTWTILPDGRPYLSTLKVMPKK